MHTRETLKLVAAASAAMVTCGIALVAPPASADGRHDVVGRAQSPAARAGRVRGTPTPPTPPPPPTTTPPPVAGIDPRCRIAGVALCANKTQRKLFVVKNGQVVATFDARFGRPGYDTPEGVHRIYSKVANEWSWKYNARMPWSMYFIGGYAVHYSSTFAQIGWAPPGGSHGCINLRDWEGAKALFASTAIGTKVVVYR